MNAPPRDRVDPERAAREAMVREQIEARGLRDRRLLAAMATVPRERFVPDDVRDMAHEDGPLPIGEGQTISQPYIVACMADALALDGDERVLEVGTGSGYGAAVLGELAAEVHTIERLEGLAASARARLAELGVGNVHVHVGDGSLGWPGAAPYDGIVVTAAGPALPEALLAQLAPGGRLVMPVGERPVDQRLLRVTRDAEGRDRVDDLGGVRFVPLIGAEGFDG